MLNKNKVFKNKFGHFRSGWRIIFYIVLFIILSKLFDTMVSSYFLIKGENLTDYELLVNRFLSKGFKFLSVLIPGLLLLKWIDKRPTSLLGLGFYKGNIKELSIGMIIGLLMGLLSIILMYAAGSASFSLNEIGLDLLLYILGVLGVLIISAFFEEVFFRGYIFQSLIEGSNFIITLIIFSLLFGAAHISNEGATFYTIMFTISAGIFLGVLYYKTRALWMCIGMHFMWNWTVGPLFGIGLSDSKFLQRSLFSYEPLDTSMFIGADAIGEIIQTIILVTLTIVIWRTKWFKPMEYNTSQWMEYPPRYGIKPIS